MSDAKLVIHNNIERFNGFSKEYDKYRPTPPPIIVDTLTNYIGETPKLVVDLGCGTGLSTFIWQDYCDKVVGIDPNEEMLQVALSKSLERKNSNNIKFQFGYGNDTQLQSGIVDIVTCSSSFHWMEPDSTIREVTRILRDNGVFAIYGHDHPSGVDWIVEKSYNDLLLRIYSFLDNLREDESKVKLWSLNDFVETMKSSGEFAFIKEIVFHNIVELTADDYIGLFFSQGAVQDILKHNNPFINTEIKQFTDLVNERLGKKKLKATYGYRVRFGIKNPAGIS
jgi:ubiquinone/menaquinone biosynthesis C-methylase UbiE